MRALHEERLRPPATWWLLAAAFSLTVGWSFLLATPPWFAGVAALATLTVVGGGLWSAGSLRVAVLSEAEGPVLVAGRARLPLRHAGVAQALDREQTRHRMGAGADVRAFLVTRPHLRVAVLVPVDDPRDPTPYWLVGTRSPEHLVSALRAAGSHLTD